MAALRARLGSSVTCAGRLFLRSATHKNSKFLGITGCNVTKQTELFAANLLQHKYYSTATEQKETVKGEPEKREFQAETRMLLDIVARSLYSDKEVFIRELISNASDALEKFRYLSVSAAPDAAQLEQTDRALEIRLSTDKQNRTITFQDSGIGMTKEELTQNLGTIARSGSKSFIEEIKNKGAEEASSIIGQFGVGFYSAFMVADKIEVFTRSSKTGSVGYKWSSDGSGTYEIQEAEGVPVGTKIVVHLKTDCREFSDDDRVKNIIKKYSNFIGSPIFLNNEQVNSIKPLWLMEPKEVSREQHVEFYRFISNSFDKPRFTLHYKTDAPLSIRSILYVPEGKPGLFEMSRDSDVGVALYSRKILIKSKAENILPKWMRFVKGVVDSEDIPLNLSRELLQNSALITKLRTVLTNRFLKYMIDQSQKDPVGYDAFYKDYSLFLKEGIVTSQSPLEREEIAKLLRFESSKLEKGVRTSLSEYGARQKDAKKPIYYLAAPSRELAETSPYYESLKKQDVEVLFCYEMYDELVLLELKEFGGRQLLSVESDMQTDSSNSADTIIGSDDLQKEQAEELISFLKSNLSGKVFEVRTTQKLDTYPCVIVIPEMAAARHFIRTQAQNLSEENRFSLLRPQLEINTKHPIIKKLHKLTSCDKELAVMVSQQLFSNAMVTAGLVMDPRNLITHINDLLTKALEKH
ncbi:heat shock protein 75 kDa, mitochondrial [Pectinophora gossypiella]|uniref:heat shock protein 75 kDa, mitochondrial n=1 Tax=Pectinophora gossypiella TaxID=13191 RepID=UPI00214ED399|nr:heat shock protein 75 kDa, mitochondrial [Pectinophora gossypiella]